MQKITFTIAIIAAAALSAPFAGFAKEGVAGYLFEYDQKLETDTNGNGVNDRTSYYQGDRLVWTAYDEDENGAADLWFRFKNGDTVDLELADRDGDGEPDLITEVSSAEKAEVIFDEQAAGGGASSWWVYAAVAAVMLGVAVFYRKELLSRFAAGK
ncbi:MAG: hypothetical protein AAB581_00975 [Patescibacteria group bacterium]